MKRLYARFVLWLIRPALEMHVHKSRVAVEHALKVAKDAVTASIRKGVR